MYLDNCATTAINKEVLDEAIKYLTSDYGNPSSLHQIGKTAKSAIEDARVKVAKSINAEPNQIFFFSSATEANNAVLNYYAFSSDCSNYEHSSVIFCKINHLDKIDLYSHMMVNNETGDVFDVKSLCKYYHNKGIMFHTDATQAFGKIPIDVKDLDVDFLTFSGHKIYSMKGCAVLYIKDITKCNLIGILFGGNQESGIHPGTENVPAIAAIGKACEMFNYNNLSEYTKSKIDNLYQKCLNVFEKSGLDYRINSISLFSKIKTIINISFKNIDGESLQNLLDSKGVYVSTSSACSSGIKKSRVLEAMNVPEDYIYGAIRISFSIDEIINNLDYIDEVLRDMNIIVDTVKELNMLCNIGDVFNNG